MVHTGTTGATNFGPKLEPSPGLASRLATHRFRRAAKGKQRAQPGHCVRIPSLGAPPVCWRRGASHVLHERCLDVKRGRGRGAIEAGMRIEDGATAANRGRVRLPSASAARSI